MTERAAKHVAGFIEKRGKGVGLRLGVRTTGCSGMAYKLEYADAPQPEAVRVTVEQGPHTLRTADVAPGDPADFVVDEGDYTVRAQSLVPAGEAASIAVAVPYLLAAVVSEA
jgi:Fe-S cluster assembly iron-binding protein IscA